MEDEDGAKFYAEAEAILANLPRFGIPMILRGVRSGAAKPYSFSGMQKIVHTMRDKLGLPSTFTLDACRHGGMTELEEAELTDGQGRALSAHKSRATRTAWRTLREQAFRMSSRTTFRTTPAEQTWQQNNIRSNKHLGWLGRQDSNLGMAESKSAALPLGYAPNALGCRNRAGSRARYSGALRRDQCIPPLGHALPVRAGRPDPRPVRSSRGRLSNRLD